MYDNPHLNDLEDQERNIEKEKLRELQIRQMAINNHQTRGVLESFYTPDYSREESRQKIGRAHV